MNKETYLKKREQLKESFSKLSVENEKLRTEYIESNKPCNIGDSIEVVTYGDRLVKGVAHSFSISSLQDVYVSSIKPIKGAIVYLSVPHKSITIN
ncbi:MAG: hypothetical protein K9J84_10595 [Bacteroidia bacterium]|nr:hypothetical protein [Bacteroidia bacterium]